MTPKKSILVYAFFTFFWFVITSLSALLYSRAFLPESWQKIFSPVFHPHWATATIFLIIPLQWWWIHKLSGNEVSVRDQSSRRYLMIFLLVAAGLTGFATNMGFLPFFFHELTVWPLLLLGIWDFAKSLRGK